MKFKDGDAVRIVDREVTPADVKSGTYYQYFGGLVGVVDRIYDDEVCVKVDVESLPDAIRKRHLDVQESIKRKWLTGLSGEARGRLTPEEKQFQLAYTMLVRDADLEKLKAGDRPATVKVARPAKPAAEIAEADVAPVPEARQPEAVVKAKKSPALQKADESSAEPAGADDLTEAEIAFLREREEALKKRP